MENIKTIERKIDEAMKDIPIFQKFEAATGLPKTTIVAAGVVLLSIFLLFNFAGAFISNFLGWVYPALETPDTKDDKQWLTYWAVLGFFLTVEYFSNIILYWVPFYFFFKTAILVWLFLPQTKGAEFLYTRFLRNIYLQYKPTIEEYLGKIKDHKITKAAEEIAEKAKK